jgi:hypothetical protein
MSQEDGKSTGEALAKITGSASLATLEQVSQLIDRCRGLEDLRALREQAAAAAAYAKVKGLCLEVQNSIWEIRQRAEQELSKLLTTAERGKTGPKLGNSPLPNSEYQAQLDAAGVNKMAASRWRETEDIPPAAVHEYVEEATKKRETTHRKKLASHAARRRPAKPQAPRRRMTKYASIDNLDIHVSLDHLLAEETHVALIRFIREVYKLRQQVEERTAHEQSPTLDYVQKRLDQLTGSMTYHFDWETFPLPITESELTDAAENISRALREEGWKRRKRKD